MSHFAEIDENNIVKRVIVVEQEVLDTGLFGDPSKFIQTSYNTYGNTHTLGGTPLRKNFASEGYIYDVVRDAFYEPQPFPSWTLNEDTCLWEPPVPRPYDGMRYDWNEETLNWVQSDIN